MATVHVGKDAVGDREQSGFSGVVRTETMLGWGEEMVFGQVRRELSLHQALDNFSYGGNYGNGTLVRDLIWITGFENGVNYGVLPRIGNVT